MSPTPLILGHRGASAVAPENTLAAFSRALRDGADGIEFDVRLSRDGALVVIHDATLRRTGLRDGIVRDLGADELQDVDVGTWFDERAQSSRISYAGEKLPTLAQVFEFFSSHEGLLYLEMKCDSDNRTELAAEVVRLVLQTEMAERVVVESFDLAAIVEIKRIEPRIRTAALFEPKLSRPISMVRRQQIIDLARRHSANEIALHHTLVSPRVIEKARHEGLDVVVWTVDDVCWVNRARTLGIKGLIVNDPAPMVTHRNNPASIASVSDAG